MILFNISAIYELEVGKFMAKLQSKQRSDYFSSLFSLSSFCHSFFTRSGANSNFFRIRSKLNKTDRSIKIAGPKIWNNFPKTTKENFEKGNPFKNALKKHLLHSQEFRLSSNLFTID